MDLITNEDIRRVVSRNAFENGLEYQLDGRVESVRAAPDGCSIEARVRGGGRSPYRQTIRLAPMPGGRLAISGGCTCPVGFNCKHVAATLLAYREQHASDLAPPVLAPRDVGGAERTTAAEAPLQPDIDAWLRSLDAVQQVETEDYPSNVRKRLLYILDRGSHSGELMLDLHTIDLNRHGVTNGRSCRYHPPTMGQGTLLPPKPRASRPVCAP